MAITKYLEVVNGNHIVIDDTFQSYYLLEKITGDKLKALCDKDINDGLRISVTDTSEAIYAIGSNHESITIMKGGEGASQLRDCFYYASSSELSNDELYNNVVLYKLGISKAPSVSHYGIQIYNDKGQEVFDATKRYMSVVDMVFEPQKTRVIGHTGHDEVFFDKHYNCKKIALIILKSQYTSYRPNDDVSVEQAEEYFSINGNNLKRHWLNTSYTYDDDEYGWWDESDGALFMVIDSSYF